MSSTGPLLLQSLRKHTGQTLKQSTYYKLATLRLATQCFDGNTIP